MSCEINARRIDRRHRARLLASGMVRTVAADRGEDALWRAIEDNHRHNCLLWLEEDRARSTDAAPAEIARCKRRIDRQNQARNDAVERIDEALCASFADVRRAPDARQHSETPGAMIDRLSILRLKIHHMGLQARRREAGAEHMTRCAAKLECLVEQHADLARCLDALLADCRAGRAYFKMYRQFKMYNDPALNPWLYAPAQRIQEQHAG